MTVLFVPVPSTAYGGRELVTQLAGDSPGDSSRMYPESFVGQVRITSGGVLAIFNLG